MLNVMLLKAIQKLTKRAHPDLNQGPADLQSAALTTQLCTQAAHLVDHSLVLVGLDSKSE